MTETGPQATLLPDGRRLHLHHGPIDLIIEVFDPKPEAYYARAIERFQTILTGLVPELAQLRRPLLAKTSFSDPVARRMAQVTRPYTDVFVTPMAAVAGSVADEVLAFMVAQNPPPKAYVNNGGDIAFHLLGDQTLTLRSPTGEMTLSGKDPTRGIATSGWQGRSHSLGIADAVTVAAPTAAAADIAATLIANAVDLPDHPAIKREPAHHRDPDSDLGRRPITTQVGQLTHPEIETALTRGAAYARRLRDQGHIQQAALCLRGQSMIISTAPQSTPIGDLAHV